jgi:transglutaminase-like putative cysteine protease/tetratricopeptide (TPR) repeat protein
MIAVVSATSIRAQQPPHFSTDTKAFYQKSSQATPPSGSDVLVLEDDDTFVFDADGKLHRSSYLVYKILTQRGAEGWADVSIGWEPWREEHPTLRVRVITPDFVEHLLDAKTIADAPAKDSEQDVFSDRRVMRAPLPAIAPGSVVEEEESFLQAPAFAGAGIVWREYFGRSVPVQHSLLVLDAPSSLPLHYNLQLLSEIKPRRTESDGRVHVAFDSGPTEPLSNGEPNWPSDIPAYPSVTFSSGTSWQQIAEEYSNIVDKQIAGADLDSVVAKITAGKSSRDDKAAAILQYLDREIRYTGVEFGEASIIPRSPGETLTRKYGDCKDKSALLVAMLRAAGISAYVVLLDAGRGEDVPPDLPGMGMFDHAIVYVPGEHDLWIDATDDYARLGQLPVADQNRRVLIARAGTTALVQTPSTSSAENTELEKREVHLAEYGPARIIETSQPHGDFESSYRRSYADTESKSTKDDLIEYVKSQYLAEKLDRIDRSDPNDLSKQFELILECDRAKRGFTDLNVAVAAIRFDTLFNALPSDLRQREKEESPEGTSADSRNQPKKKRTEDYQLADASVTEWQYAIFPPPGFRPKPLPRNTKVSLGPAVLSEEFSASADGVVHADFRFDTVKSRMSVSEATEMRNSVAQIRGGEPVLIYFEPIGEALLNEGKIREALQSYRDLIALHPNEAVHHLQIAKALLAAGMGEVARSEAQTAIKLEPSSALAEKTYAEILQYDVIGRKLRPGSDFAGAEAAYRAAEKLDPSDKATVANVAILLEYNRWGVRYGPGARLKDAVAEYRKLTLEKLTELGLSNNLAFALFYAGDFSEARKNAETLNPQPLGLIVACESAINGSQAGLAEARKRTVGEEQFKGTVTLAGQMLANVRNYPLAADLLEAGASGDNASNTAADAVTYRKAKLHEHMSFTDDPTGIAMHFIALELDPDLKLDQLRSICSRNGQLALAIPDVVDLLVKDQRRSYTQRSRTGSLADVGVDMLLAKAQPKVDGNDSTGYKITVWPSASYKDSIFVVREDGKYNVLASSNYFGALGLEILDRVAANDLVGARTLLDWMREDSHLAGGDDPLSGFVFPRFWTRGKDADAFSMKLAAAALAAVSKEAAPRGISVLEAAKDSARTDVERTNIATALMYAYWGVNDYEKGLPLALALTKQFPESRSAFQLQSLNLRALRRFDEDERLTSERIQRLPGDIWAMRESVKIATARGDYAAAHALSQKIVDVGEAETDDLNSTAWLSLFNGMVQDSDIEEALKAAQLSNNNPSILHTLGCLYAEVGKTKEARNILVQSIDSLGLDEPDENYWYAFGRIAEQYGERDAAAADYHRVAKPAKAIEVVLPDSSYALAQVRLQALGAPKQ